MQASHNLIWPMIALFFAILIGMVFNAWRKNNDAIDRKLQSLGRPQEMTTDVQKAKSRATATYKGAALQKALEEIDLKVQTDTLKAENYDRLKKSQQKALYMMASINVVLASGLVYALYRFLTT